MLAVGMAKQKTKRNVKCTLHYSPQVSDSLCLGPFYRFRFEPDPASCESEEGDPTRCESEMIQPAVKSESEPASCESEMIQPDVKSESETASCEK